MRNMKILAITLWQIEAMLRFLIRRSKFKVKLVSMATDLLKAHHKLLVCKAFNTMVDIGQVKVFHIMVKVSRSKVKHISMATDLLRAHYKLLVCKIGTI